MGDEICCSRYVVCATLRAMLTSDDTPPVALIVIHEICHATNVMGDKKMKDQKVPGTDRPAYGVGQ